MRPGQHRHVVMASDGEAKVAALANRADAADIGDNPGEHDLVALLANALVDFESVDAKRAPVAVGPAAVGICNGVEADITEAGLALPNDDRARDRSGSGRPERQRERQSRSPIHLRRAGR